MEDQLNFKRLESEFKVDEIDKDTTLVTEKIDEELQLRSKLSN